MSEGITRLSCDTCNASFTLDRDGVVAAAELETFVAAHVYCGGTLRIGDDTT